MVLNQVRKEVSFIYKKINLKLWKVSNKNFEILV